MTCVKACHGPGKSFIAGSIAGWWIGAHPIGEAFIVTMAPTGHQVKGILWREINRLHREAQLPGVVTQSSWKMPISGEWELVGIGRSPKDTDPTAIQGYHAKWMLVILDEACGIGPGLWSAAESLLSNEFCRFVAIGNPDDPASEFAKNCKPGAGSNVITISAFDTPNFTGEEIPEELKHVLTSKIWVAEREKKWGKTSPLYKSKVLGEFPEQSKDGLVSLADLSAAQHRELDYGLPNELGVDVARFGDNFTTGYQRRGPVYKRRFRYQGRDTMETVGYILQTLRAQRGITRVKIDDTGVGGGVTDRLMELKRSRDPRDAQERLLLNGVSVIGVNVGEAPSLREQKVDKEKRYTETERFHDLRAQLNWGARQLFVDGAICFEDGGEEDEVFAQAGDMRYRLTSRGHIQIESKEDMVKRGGVSPDDWDALVLAAAENVADSTMETWRKLGAKLGAR
jgi:hypothetical protein